MSGNVNSGRNPNEAPFESVRARYRILTGEYHRACRRNNTARLRKVLVEMATLRETALKIAEAVG